MHRDGDDNSTGLEPVRLVSWRHSPRIWNGNCGHRLQDDGQHQHSCRGSEDHAVMRQCGGCTLCCLIPRVAILSKPSGKWCWYCNGKGCTIYDHRPRACKDFTCLWLASDMPDEWRPDRLHFYISGSENDEVLKVRVDPAFPDAWMYSPVIDHFLQRGKHLLVCVGFQVTFLPAKGKPMPEKIMLEWML
jgi:hypothetical protein